LPAAAAEGTYCSVGMAGVRLGARGGSLGGVLLVHHHEDKECLSNNPPGSLDTVLKLRKGLEIGDALRRGQMANTCIRLKRAHTGFTHSHDVEGLEAVGVMHALQTGICGEVDW
jgi:hypothetical protein